MIGIILIFASIPVIAVFILKNYRNDTTRTAN